MCGIIAYSGTRNGTEVLIEGLRRLEYRGYDSAGIAVHGPASPIVLKCTGRVDALARAVFRAGVQSRSGIGHTRWATHGAVTQKNAHPHASSDGSVVLVHNGVVENHLILKRLLSDQGFHFASQTDTEVLANLIAWRFRDRSEADPTERLLEAVREALPQVEGTYGIALLAKSIPGLVLGARRGSPLIVGIGPDEHLLASDVSALVASTNRVVYLNDGEIAVCQPKSLKISTVDSREVAPIIAQVDWSIEQSELGDFTSYMEKEIFEQPEALANAMRGRFSGDRSTAKFGGLNLSASELRQIDRIVLTGCGTAWHACLLAEHLIERYARIPVEVDYASELRYRNPPLPKNTVLIAFSQSGETIDTLACLQEAKRKGIPTLAIVNVVGSSIAREVDGGIYQHAGPEIGVASTKAFTSQVALAALLALHLGRLRDMSYEEGRTLVAALETLPELVRGVLANSGRIHEIAARFAHARDFLFLGRQTMFPVALEGALKLKEISYIHAEAYPAAEMKHGPIALVSPDCPVVFLAPQSDVFKKSLANMEEIHARGAPIIAVLSEDSELPAGLVDAAIRIPRCHDALLPILAAIPLQLLSYFIARELRRDVDKPRNLAKSVTVE